MRPANGLSPGAAISAVVLLAGGLMPPPLARAAGRSVLDLTPAPDESVLEQWVRLLGEAGLDGVPVRAMHGPQIPAPRLPAALEGRVEVIRERDAYRGPAGAIRDAIADLPADAWTLVIEATRFHRGPLSLVIDAAASGRADVFVSSNADRTPAGVYAMRRAVLDHVASVGYVDMKEQLLQRARDAGDRVHVVTHDEIVSFPLRTRPELLRAASMRAWAAAPARLSGPTVLTGERWPSVVSARAQVDPTAVVIESVVMEGARVGAGAVVARSVLCPGAEVASHDVALDQVVSALPARVAGLASPGGDRRRVHLRPRLAGIRLGRRAEHQQGTAT